MSRARSAPRARRSWSRRELVRGGAFLIGGVGLGARRSGTQAPPSAALGPGTGAGSWGWHLDADGDGSIGPGDRAIVEAAIGSKRGRGIAPLPGWDVRADVIATGSIGVGHRAALEAHPDGPLPARPMVACFHYGWYRGTQRRAGHPTMRYRGGAYTSASRTTEEAFNRLKHEFGIGADLLSWIDRNDIRAAWERGYLSAHNLGTRRFGLLYETVINLGGDGARLRFGEGSDVPARLVAGFRAMGEWAAAAVARRGARPLLIDERPVVYVFASHLFGDTHDDLPWVGRALVAAREAFAEAFGAEPWLIGDESPFPHDAGVGIDRAWRARFLDAVTRYHHYDEREARALAPDGRWRLDAAHRVRLIANERRAIEGFRGIRNEITGHPILVVPSSAAGFAKRGLPVLTASEDDYLAYLRDVQALTDRHLAADHPDRGDGRRLPFPLVLAGSWNEEFEGHALMPAAHNAAMIDGGRGGFEWLWALRRIYGWNHYAGPDGASASIPA